MSLDRITAQFFCDECGEPFKVNMDPATKTTGVAFTSLFDFAEDELRGGLAVVEARNGFSCIVSIQEGKHLCGICTEAYDKEGEE